MGLATGDKNRPLPSSLLYPCPACLLLWLLKIKVLLFTRQSFAVAGMTYLLWMM